MRSSPLRPLILRLADPRVLVDVLSACGIESPSPHWRRHAPGLLTLQIPDPAGDQAARLSTLAGVERVFDLSMGWLHHHWPFEAARHRRLGDRLGFEDGKPVVIAGPCSVEGRAQVRGIAELVAEAGADGLRGGVFKPRTSPYEFGGFGEEGLAMLVEAGRATGLPVVTEVLEPACLDAVAAGADVLQIGSRNMHNAPFLFALGAHPSGRPALLKRGLAATVDELLWAAEYFLLGRLAGGHEEPGLVLCERGVRSFETSTRFMLDVGAIPTLRGRTWLPVLVDPSHPAGDRELVPALAHAGLAAGADGLLVEVHTEPAKAWCDGAQSLGPEAFLALMRRIRAEGPRQATGPLRRGPHRTLPGAPPGTDSRGELPAPLWLVPGPER